MLIISNSWQSHTLISYSKIVRTAASRSVFPERPRHSSDPVVGWKYGQPVPISPYMPWFQAPLYYALPAVHGWESVQCRSLVFGPSSLLLPVLGTVCPNMSHLHPLCLFSEVASRLSSSGVPSHNFYRNFCSAWAVTLGLSTQIDQVESSWMNWTNELHLMWHV